jgi:hypothetical protein
MAIAVGENTNHFNLGIQELCSGKPARLIRCGREILGQIQKQNGRIIHFQPTPEGDSERQPATHVVHSSEIDTGHVAFFEHPQLALPSVAPEDFYVAPHQIEPHTVALRGTAFRAERLF